MKTSKKVLLSSAALLTAFALGRYTVPESTKTQTDTQTETKTDTQKKTDLERNKETTVTEVTLPDGTKEKTTKTTETTKKKTDTEKTGETTTDAKTSTETTRGASPVTISLLVGTDRNMAAPTYGAAITRPLLGPLTVGGFGLSSGVFGLAIGLSF